MPVIQFVFFILDGLLQILTLLLIVSAIASWLLVFDIINLRNPTMRQLYFGLQAVIDPMLKPLRRFIPSLGGLDLSFLVLFLIIQGVRKILLPAAYNSLAGLG